MLDKLSAVEARYEALGEQLADPTVLGDPNRFKKVARSHAALQPVVDTYREYLGVQAEIEATSEMLADPDPEMSQMAKAEMASLQKSRAQLEERLRILLLPKDPNDEKNVIIEIRAGAGGEEAALFAGVLFRMYARYAESQRWKTEILSSSETGLGGFKEVVLLVEGLGAYSQLKFESGVHRVQRVPETEASGRIHTSTATVAVLPEVEEVEVDINPNDLRIDVFRSSGPGGQSVNTTDSAVRVTHIPTGIVISCQDEKSQHKNKDKALKILRAKLYESAQEAQRAETAENRKSQVGTGDRSERIRTYNYPQGRLTDHRIGLTLYRLEEILGGDIGEIIASLIQADQTEKLKELE